MKTRVKFKKEINAIINKAPVPLKFEDDFFIYKLLPVKAKDFTLTSDKMENCPCVGIVIQGPILKENDFTLETIKNYKKTFNNPNLKIILSTWNEEDLEYINEFKKLDIEVITSEMPLKKGLLNLNCQIKSTQEGVKRAKILGCEYILKTRTDQRFYATNIIEFLLNVLKTFPIGSEGVNQKERLVVLSFNTFKYRIYGISDMFLFGHIDDVERYWSLDYCDKEELTRAEKLDHIKTHLYRTPETHIIKEYLKKIGHPPKLTLEDSLDVYAKYFCMVDKETVELFWPKYTNADRRWESFEYSEMEELKFREWLNLYFKNGVQPTYTIQNFKNPPPPKLNLSYFFKFPRRALERKDQGEKLTIF